MKKYVTFLFMLIGLGTMMTVSAQPIPPLDSGLVWIPRQDAKNVLSKALEAEILTEKLLEKEKDIKALTERIDGLKQIVSVMQDKDKLNQSVSQSYEKQIKEMTDMRKLFELDVKVYQKQIKKLKRGKFWTAMAGVAATVGALWLGTNL